MIDRILAYFVGWKAYAAGGVAALLALSLYTGAVVHYARKGVADKVQTRVVTRIVKEVGKETVRRETVLRRVQVRSKADIKKIDRLATERAALLEEIRNASVAHNGDSCLSADSIMRLAAIR